MVVNWVALCNTTLILFVSLDMKNTARALYASYCLLLFENKQKKNKE